MKTRIIAALTLVMALITVGCKEEDPRNSPSDRLFNVSLQIVDDKGENIYADPANWTDFHHAAFSAWYTAENKEMNKDVQFKLQDNSPNALIYIASGDFKSPIFPKFITFKLECPKIFGNQEVNDVTVEYKYVGQYDYRPTPVSVNLKGVDYPVVGGFAKVVVNR